MTRQILFQASRLASRVVRRSNISHGSLRLAMPIVSATIPRALPSSMAFSSSSPRQKGIMPDTDSPATEAKSTEPAVAVAELSEGEYHELADAYLETVLSKVEELQDAREDLDIEYSAGVMTITVTNKGTYVLNKQPPNKQIWLSSPISGPKRYDWCVVGDSQGDKEGTASGHWIYARDGSSLDEILLEEIEVDLARQPHE